MFLQLVIRKQPGMAIGDDQEADGFMHILLAASNLQTLHADDPVLTSLGRVRNFKAPVRSLVLTHQCDLRRLLRCFPDLTSIEFGCMPLSSIDSRLSPKLERFRGPVPCVMPLVPGRPVHSVDISSVCDSDQIACVVQALRRATVPTRAFRFPLTTRGNVEYRMRMLACVADLADLEQLAVDSDVGVQTTEVSPSICPPFLFHVAATSRTEDPQWLTQATCLRRTLHEHLRPRSHGPFLN